MPRPGPLLRADGQFELGIVIGWRLLTEAHKAATGEQRTIGERIGAEAQSASKKNCQPSCSFASTSGQSRHSHCRRR